jgi:hypothetical protein
MEKGWPNKPKYALDFPAVSPERSHRPGPTNVPATSLALSTTTAPTPATTATSSTTTTTVTRTRTMQAVHALPPPAPYSTPYSSRPAGSRTNMAAMPTPPAPTARKRKRATNYSVAYSEIKEFDAAGQARDVIVIEDTPPPATASPATSRASKAFSTSYQPTSLAGPVRTRARAAREAQAMSANSSSSTIIAPPPLKKRKRETDTVGGSAKKPATNAYPPYPVATSKSWAGASVPAVEVRGAAIIVYTNLILTPHDRHRPNYPQSPATTKRATTLSVPTT